MKVLTSMTNTKIVKKSDYANAAGSPWSRLDSEFFSEEFLNVEQHVLNKTSKRIGKLTLKYDGPIVNKDLFEEDAEVKYISIDNVDTEYGLTFNQEFFYKDRPSRASYVVKTSDVLVSNVRPNRGGVALISERLDGALASSGFTLLRLDTDEITPEFLFAFLKTDYGRTQLIRRNRSSMYPAVSEGDVLDVNVPIPSITLLNSVTTLIKESQKAQNKFFELINSQRNLISSLLENLKVPPSPLLSELKEVDTAIVTKKDVFETFKRIDADFYRHEYQDSLEDLKSKLNYFKLGDYYDHYSGRSLGNGEEEVPYVKQSVLTNSGINWSAVSYELGSLEPSTGRVKVEDILLACTAHEIYYVGRKVDYVENVPNEIENTNIAVADIIILRHKEDVEQIVSGYYIAAILRHDFGLHQVQRCIRGLRGGHVYGQDILQNVYIPIPDKKWLSKFDGISSDINVSKQTAKEKFNEALTLINNWLK